MRRSRARNSSRCWRKDILLGSSTLRGHIIGSRLGPQVDWFDFPQIPNLLRDGVMRRLRGGSDPILHLPADVPGRVLQLLEVDLLLDGASQLHGGAPELDHRLAEGPADFGQPAGPENEQSDPHQDQHFEAANRAKHTVPSVNPGHSSTVPDPSSIFRPDSRHSEAEVKRSILYAAGGLALVAALALSRTSPRLSAATNEQDNSLQTFTQILDVVEQKYVDDVNSQELIYGAIRGMLGTLDPHSAFLDPKTYKEMKEEQQGSFSGLGIVISLKGEDKELTVISPIEVTPAYRAGIRAGDFISQIEGKPTQGITIDEALERLRGPKGSKVTITIQREGYDQPLQYTLIRDDIPTVSIPYAYMVRPGIGYIRIKSFTQTTDSELEEKLRLLKSQGMEKLLLDLRWNPGGLLLSLIHI